MLRPKPVKPPLSTSITISAPPMFCYVRPHRVLNDVQYIFGSLLILFDISSLGDGEVGLRQDKARDFGRYMYSDIASGRDSCWLVRKDQSGLPAWWPTMPLGTLLDWIPPGPTMSLVTAGLTRRYIDTLYTLRQKPARAPRGLLPSGIVLVTRNLQQCTLTYRSLLSVCQTKT